TDLCRSYLVNPNGLGPSYRNWRPSTCCRPSSACVSTEADAVVTEQDRRRLIAHIRTLAPLEFPVQQPAEDVSAGAAPPGTKGLYSGCVKSRSPPAPIRRGNWRLCRRPR